VKLYSEFEEISEIESVRCEKDYANECESVKKLTKKNKRNSTTERLTKRNCEPIQTQNGKNMVIGLHKTVVTTTDTVSKPTDANIPDS
jgi:hypothetical protein